MGSFGRGRFGLYMNRSGHSFCSSGQLQIGSAIWAVMLSTN